MLQKNGVVKEGELGPPTKRDGQYHDLWQHQLTNAEYAQLGGNENSYFIK